MMETQPQGFRVSTGFSCLSSCGGARLETREGTRDLCLERGVAARVLPVVSSARRATRERRARHFVRSARTLRGQR